MNELESTEILEENSESIDSSETEEKLLEEEEDEGVSLEEIMQESSTEISTYTTVDMTDVNNRLDGIYSCLVVIITLLGVTCGIVLGGVLWKRLR